MGCRSDYMEPTAREIENKLVIELLDYVCPKMNLTKPYPKNNVDEATARLCEICTKMGNVEVERIMYDGRNPMARKLADWWDCHQEADRKREAEALGKCLTIDNVIIALTAAKMASPYGGLTTICLCEDGREYINFTDIKLNRDGDGAIVILSF